MIPATMISRAAPSTAMAISPALYLAPGRPSLFPA